MFAEDLTEHLNRVAPADPYILDLQAVRQRTRRLRQRRRAAGTVAALSVAATVAGSMALLQDPGPVSPDFAAGNLDIRAVEQPGPRCGFELVLPTGSTPAKIGLPCGINYPADPSRDGVTARQDRVQLPAQPTPTWITSGTAPRGTVAIEARDTAGHLVTATIFQPLSTGEVTWAMQSRDAALQGLRYVLQDGRSSQAGSISTPP